MSKNISIVPYPPFKRSGTTITQRTSGDTLALGTGSLTLNGSITLGDAVLQYSTVQTPDSLVLGVSSDSNALIVCKAAGAGLDFAHAVSTNPTLFIQSADENSYMMYGSLSHNQTNANLKSGYGGCSIGIDAQKALGTLTMTGLPSAGETFVINATACTARASGATTNEFNIGADVTTTLDNIVSMILAGAETANVKCWKGSASTVLFEWKTAGVSGNAIIFTTALTNTSMTGTGLLGGLGATNTGRAANSGLTVNASGSISLIGNAIFASNLRVTSTTSANGASFYPLHTSQTPDAGILTTGVLSNSLIICEDGDISYDFAHAIQTNPTLYIQSASQSATQWMSLAHNQTDGVISVGTGVVSIPSGISTGSLELGNADTTLTRTGAGAIAVEGVAVPTISSTNTLTNKRVTKRVTTTTDDVTAEINIDNCDVYELSAVANNTEFTTTGTPTDGQTLTIRLKDAGVAKNLTWTGFTALGVTLPATTTAGKWMYFGAMYNTAATAWHIITYSVQA